MTNWTRKLEAVVKPVLIVGGFLILLGVFLAKEAHADTQLEIGAGFLSGEFSQGGSLIISERYGHNGKYALGMGYISEQEVTDRSGHFYAIQENLFVFAQRRVCQKWMCLGLGPAYFNGTNRALGSNFTAALSVELEKGNWSVNLRHFSNAGSARPNMGQDMLTVGYAFR